MQSIPPSRVIPLREGLAAVRQHSISWRQVLAFSDRPVRLADSHAVIPGLVCWGRLHRTCLE